MNNLMMRSLLGVLVALATLAANGQVMRCTEGMDPIADERLQLSVDQVKSKYPGMVLQADARPCMHAKATLAALAATLGRGRLTKISGYEFVKIVNGEAYFTVERFRSANLKALRALATAMDADQFRKLKVKTNTSYDYFLAEDSIVIMISSVGGRAGNAEMFSQLRQAFTSLESLPRK